MQLSDDCLGYSSEYIKLFIKLRTLEKPEDEPCSVSSAKLSVRLFLPLSRKQTFPSSPDENILFYIELKLKKGEMLLNSPVHFSAVVLSVEKLPDLTVMSRISKVHDRDR